MQKFKKNRIFLSVFQNSFFISEKQQQTILFSIFPSEKAVYQDFAQAGQEKKRDIEETLFFNFSFDKGRLKTIVCWFFERHGQYKTLKLLEKLKEIGFGSATNAGISLGIDDLKIPSQKIALLSKAETKVAKDFVHYRNAKITGIERIQRLIYTWNQTNDTLKQEVVRLFESTDLLNPIYMMAFSGARGNMSQVRQLVGMRGLMSDPQGQIIDFPIQSNFREGLTLTEYLISTYGARKGIVDTALRTATAGYLTRRLVDVAQHTIVSKFDCGTMRGIFLFDMKDGKKTIYSFQNRLIGRVLAQNIEFSDKIDRKGKVEKNQLAFRNQEIDSKLAEAISNVTKKAFVRSPLTCETSRFVCQLCYGWSFSYGKLVSIGEAVGIIAAQSIGEPGTQLTMRTFHTGGVFAGGLTDQIFAPFDGKIKYLKNIPGTCVRNGLSEIAFLTKIPGSFLVEKVSPLFEQQKQFVQPSAQRRKKGEIFKIPAYALLFCRNNEFVRKKQVLAQFSSVLRKVQFGTAEQTLYSTLAGEFVFGKSLFSKQKPKLSLDSPLFGNESQVHDHKILFDRWTQPLPRIRPNPHPLLGRGPTSNREGEVDQCLILEKKGKGDFSEVELKNDVLWKSQNWTTVWVLSGKVFSDSFHTNFSFQEGDFLKKTSVLQRILWTKKKQYKYDLYRSCRVQKEKNPKNEYLLALQKKKIHDSFFQFVRNSHVKKTFQNQNKNSFVTKVQTNFNLCFLAHKTKTTSTFDFVHVPSPPFHSQFAPGADDKSFFVSKRKNKHIFLAENLLIFFAKQKIRKTASTFFSQLFFESQKKNDFLFLQKKATRFFTDFQKNIQTSPPFLKKNKGLLESFFSLSKTKTTASWISQKEKKSVFKKKAKRGGIPLFFRFLNKRKNFDFPFFLNFRTFSKIFQVSLKFGFFFSPFSNFSKTSFVQSRFVFSKENSKSDIFSSSMALLVLEKSSAHLFLPHHKKYFCLQKRQKQKKLFLKNSFVFHELSKKKKNKKNREKNIVLKKFFLRLPIEKIYYKKFAYFVSLFAKGKNKKGKSSFQTFSTLLKKENFLSEQRNIGQNYSLSHGSQNFYGKDNPSSFSNCFFENSQTKTGGVFSVCFFEQKSKKQRFFHFFEKFSEHDKKKIVFLKPEKVQKVYLLNNKKQKIPILSLSQHEDLFQFPNSTLFKDTTKKSKKSLFSPDSGSLCSFLHLFQIPTFSFLSLSTDFFLKSFSLSSDFLKNQKFIHSLENGNGNKFSRNTENLKFNTFESFSSKNRPALGRKTFGDFSFKFWQEDSSQTAFSQSHFPVRTNKQTNTENNKSLFQQYKRKNKNIMFPSLRPHLYLQMERGEMHPSTPSAFAGGGGKSPKIRVFYFSKDLLTEKKTKEDKKRDFFFLSNLSFNKFCLAGGGFSKNKKEQNLFSDFYIKEISLLPQENLMIFTSDILNENISTFFSFPFYSHFGNKPFLFFANRQGKKKNFSFFSDHFSATSFQSEKETTKKTFEGFLKISKRQMLKSSFQSGFKKNKKTELFFPLHQKLSFFAAGEQGAKKSKRDFAGKDDFPNKIRFAESCQNGRKEKILFDQSVVKNVALKYKKRIGNQKYKKMQRMFLKKAVFFKNTALSEFKQIEKKSPSSTDPHDGVKKNLTVFDKDLKKSYFFAKKVQNQCFACFPFQKNSLVLRNQATSLNEQVQSEHNSPFHQKTSNHQRKISLFLKEKAKREKNMKFQLKIEQGWPVLPFSPLLEKSGAEKVFFEDHKKIQKKGHFLHKNIMFEQNTVFVQTVLFQNSCFSFFNLQRNFLKTEKVFFQIDFLQRNTKCRYFSFSSLEDERKKTSDCPQISFSFEKRQSLCGDKPSLFFDNQPRCLNKSIQFPNFFAPHPIPVGCGTGTVTETERTKSWQVDFFRPCQSLVSPTRQTLCGAEKNAKKYHVMQFFRPFQYKILQNPQNVKKFFRDIRFQYFSKGISSSFFQLYKKYHSTFWSLQKKEKIFFGFYLNNQSKQNKNIKFEVQSNFQNLYCSPGSPFSDFFFGKSNLPGQNSGTSRKIKNFSFLSFEFISQQENFKKNARKMEKKFQFQETSREKKESFRKAAEFQNSFQKQFSHLDKVLMAEQKMRTQPVEMLGKEDSAVSNTHLFTFLKNFGRNTQHNFFFSFGKTQKEKRNFSFYPIQFLPLVFSLSTCDLRKSSSVGPKNKRGNQVVFPPSFQSFSSKPFQNVIEFELAQKKGTFFDERFSFRKFFDFVQTSSFWLNKDRMNFLFSRVSRQKTFQKIQLKENPTCVQNSVFEKNTRFFGSTEFLSPYEGEILSMFTQNMYWWKKASEVSTIQNFEKLVTIVTKKDLFSIRFSFDGQSSLFGFSEQEKNAIQRQFAHIDGFVEKTNNDAQKNKTYVSSSKSKELTFLKQKHLRKLYEIVTQSSFQKNSFLLFKNQNKTKKKTKISSFVTKYEKKIYTFQNLTIGYPFVFQKPVLGNFVVHGANFFGSSLQKPGQIIHLSSSSMTLRRGQPCFVSGNGILHFSTTPYIEKNVPLVTLPYQTVQAGDIVQGIPKVEQFFEARTTLQGRLFVSSLPILLKGIFERYKILLPLDQATRQSFLKIQQIIVDGVQRVYRSQGVSIIDKHLEVVVRQMTTKVQILYGAQTGFFPGELVSLDFVERLNNFLMVKICYEPVILGITRASLEVDSFLSASSFQQTTKILSLAAISQKKDFLKGLKENLLVGNLIPSGTGYFQFSKRL